MKKQSLKHCESGRTMLEMLGVLGIMGIIMYGAIAGINYGMSTYKINQTYNEVQEAMQGIQDLYSWSHYYDGINLVALCDNDIFASSCDCTVSGASKNCTVSNAFGDGIAVAKAQCSGGRNCTSFTLTYTVTDDASRSRLEEMEWGEVDMTKSGNDLVFKPRD